MGKQYASINEPLTQFIEQQKMFFVGTAMEEGRVNISPKGMDSLKVLGPNRVVWLNVTGSGNETATHVQHQPRMTLMFCAFEGAPLILRLYGKAKVIHTQDPEWPLLYPLFKPLPGARQIFDMDVDLVQSSCGKAVPYYDYLEDREQLNQWANKQGEEGIQEYWKKKNQKSIDGIETGILNPDRN